MDLHRAFRPYDERRCAQLQSENGTSEECSVNLRAGNEAKTLLRFSRLNQ
jgi:hypothetical protein